MLTTETSQRIQIESAFDEFKADLSAFLNVRTPNMHLHGGDIIHVYARKGTHLTDGALTNCLDIGSITINDQYRGMGLGMRVINHMHSVNPFAATYVESLLNQRLQQRLQSEKWIVAPHSVPPSVYKYKTQRT